MRRLTRQEIVIGLDVLTVGLVILSATIARVGGFIVRFAGIRISFGTPTRTLLWLGAVLLVRLIVGRRIGPFGMSRAQWRRLLPSIGADPFLVRAPAGFWRRTAFASLGIALALAILLHDQLRPYLRAGPRRPAVFDVADRVGGAPDRHRSRCTSLTPTFFIPSA